MKLDKYLDLAMNIKPRCVFCTFSDQYEDMEESNGKWMHQECLKDLQKVAVGNLKDNHNNDHRLEMEQ